MTAKTPREMVTKVVTNTRIVWKEMENYYHHTTNVWWNIGQNKNITLSTDISAKANFNIEEVTGKGNLNIIK